VESWRWFVITLLPEPFVAIPKVAATAKTWAALSVDV
jgi:hypothetical protein